MRLARDQIAGTLRGRIRSIILGRFDDLDGRLNQIDQTLRELSHSLESSSIVDRPLGDVLQRELDGFDRRAGIEGRLVIKGSFDCLSASQRIAIFRIVQEGLANVREHAAATSVLGLARAVARRRAAAYLRRRLRLRCVAYGCRGGSARTARRVPPSP